ncbi:ORF27R [Cyprinid herpesvirus 3]|uniref:ORF27R n=1 Tax=Cyprinid herpesvirus 3 TaxID=180230 RepID=A0A060IL46_CYHV3|nr:ORF27R [Cyprinid herpesvirus 3]
MGIMPNSVWLAEPLPLLLYLLLLPSPIDAFYAVKYSSPTSATCPIAGQPYVVQALFQADNRTVTGARWLNPTNGVLTQSAIAARANITFWKTGDTWTSWLTLTPFVATDSTPYVFMLLSNSTNLTVGFTFTTNFTVPAAATFRVNVTGVNLVRCIPSCDRPGMTYTWRLNNATVVGAVAQNLTIAASGNYTCAYANSTVSNATFVQFTPPTTTQTTNTPTTITNTTTPTTIPTTPTTPTTQTAIPTTPTTPTTPTAIPTTPTPPPQQRYLLLLQLRLLRPRYPLLLPPPPQPRYLPLLLPRTLPPQPRYLLLRLRYLPLLLPRALYLLLLLPQPRYLRPRAPRRQEPSGTWLSASRRRRPQQWVRSGSWSTRLQPLHQQQRTLRGPSSS